MRNPVDYTLYLVTDQDLMSTKTLEQAVEQACEGGVTLVQIREKKASQDEFLDVARRCKAITDRFGVGLIVNDNPHVAAQIGALGVHVGQDDMEAAAVRRLLGPDMILGVTAKTVEQARRAQDAGADYLGSGAVFGSSTKLNAKPMTRETLASICAAVSLPVVAIGGIHRENLCALAGTGIAGVAIVSGIFSAEDIEAECRALRSLAEQVAG